jgi:hypothetical protein
MLREQWNRATPAERQQMLQHAREQHMKHMGAAPHGPPPRGPHH